MIQILAIALFHLMATPDLQDLKTEQEIVDLTHTLSEATTVYPGKKPFSRVICAYYESGPRLDDMHLSTGIGTHMDAPNHFCPDGVGMDAIPLSHCQGVASVIHLSDKVQTNADYGITQEDILEWESVHGKIPPHSLVLLHTGWDKYWETERFCEPDTKGVCHFPGVAPCAAQLLVDREVYGVGIDSMGIDPGASPGFLAHYILLGANIVLIENLAHLASVPPTGSIAYILPMKIKDAPESPVRAMAIFDKKK